MRVPDLLRRSHENYLDHASEEELSLLHALISRGDAPALTEAERLCSRLQRRAEILAPAAHRERREHENFLRWRRQHPVAGPRPREIETPLPLPTEPLPDNVLVLQPRTGHDPERPSTGREWVSQRTRAGRAAIERKLF